MFFYYIRIYTKLLLFLFKTQLVNKFEPDKLLQSDNCPLIEIMHPPLDIALIER
jgi:hypothetical protein